MEKLDFTHNYNGKLFMDTFGFVGMDEEMFFDGNNIEVTLKGMALGIVKVVAVRPFEYKHIRDVLAYLECGKPAHYLAELLRREYKPEGVLPPGTRLCHVVMQYEKRDIDNQRLLLQEWWQLKIEESKQPQL